MEGWFGMMRCLFFLGFGKMFYGYFIEKQLSFVTDDPLKMQTDRENKQAQLSWRPWNHFMVVCQQSRSWLYSFVKSSLLMTSRLFLRWNHGICLCLRHQSRSSARKTYCPIADTLHSLIFDLQGRRRQAYAFPRKAGAMFPEHVQRSGQNWKVQRHHWQIYFGLLWSLRSSSK